MTTATNALMQKNGGGDRIRTCDDVTAILVFKTSAFNRSATPPQGTVWGFGVKPHNVSNSNSNFQ